MKGRRSDRIQYNNNGLVSGSVRFWYNMRACEISLVVCVCVLTRNCLKKSGNINGHNNNNNNRQQQQQQQQQLNFNN